MKRSDLVIPGLEVDTNDRSTLKERAIDFERKKVKMRQGLKI